MPKVSVGVVHFRASDVSLVLAVGGGRLPRVVHWGADLGDLPQPALDALTASAGDTPAVLPEHTYGWTRTPGVAGHRDGRDHSTRFAVASVEVETDGERDRAVQRLVARATDAIADLTLVVTIEMLASGLVRARATLGSTGPGTTDAGGGGAYTLDALTLLLPVPPEATELVDLATGPSGRLAHRGAFAPGLRAWESRGGKPGPESPLIVAAGVPGFGYRAGEAWAAHVAWSGNMRHVAERREGGLAMLGGGELLYPGEARLGTGEQYVGPWVYFAHGDGLDDVTSRFHRHARSRDGRPTKPRPVAVTARADGGVPALTALADAAADVGAELFVLTDGWSKGDGPGDWYVDKTLFPEGLVPFAGYVRDLGMEFGLGFEPEMAGPTSDLARQHPEWIAQASVAGASLRLPLERNGRQVVDLTHPEAYAFVEERLRALVAEIRPAHVTLGHGRDLLEAGNSATGRAIGHAQTQAFYRLVDGMRAAFPGIEVEVRAGGGRIDLEALCHADEVADDAATGADAPVAFGVVTLIPPESVRVDLDARGARPSGDALAAIGCHLGVANLGIGSDGAPAREALRPWIEAHKRHRALLHSGDVVRSDAARGDAALRDVALPRVNGVVARNGREALYSCVGAAGAANVVRLPGLDPSRTYRVVDATPAGEDGPRTWTAEATGRVLAVRGIEAPRADGVLLWVTRA